MNRKNQTEIPTLPSTGFIRLPVFLKLVPISRAALYEGIKKGAYPRPVKLSARTSAWRVEDVRALIEKLGNQGGAND